MSQKLAGAGFGQPHEVLDFPVVVELGLVVVGKWGRLLAFDEIPDALARRFRRLEVTHLARTQRRDELDEFFIRSHAGSLASARRHDKRVVFAADRSVDGRGPSPAVSTAARCCSQRPVSTPLLFRATRFASENCDPRISDCFIVFCTVLRSQLIRLWAAMASGSCRILLGAGVVFKQRVTGVYRNELE